MIDLPKKHVFQQTIETQQTIRTQDIFPDFPEDPIVSETEPESSQEEGAGVASGIGKVCHISLAYICCLLSISLAEADLCRWVRCKDAWAETFKARVNAYMHPRVLSFFFVQPVLLSLSL
jgi:hypothetical protein